MLLKKLSILNFKNIREATLEPSPKMNCFVGANGMGKTNLLDAVYYLSFCRSATNPADSQLINHEADFFMLEGRYDDEQGGEELIHCALKQGMRKHVKRNQKEYQRLSQHIGLIPAILVSPSDVTLVSGGSDERRRLMDVAVSQYAPPYIEALSRYDKALKARNLLLRQEEEPDGSLLDVLEEEMARQGTVIFDYRHDFIDRLTPLFRDIYARISGEAETPSLAYTSHAQRGPLLDIIRRDRMKDRVVGYSLHGIHRDDLDMLIDGHTLRREGSQGQCKTYVIALKLAQFSLLKGTATHTTPILLLDDIFDKLDATRVENIVSLVTGGGFGQIFMTDTHRGHLLDMLRHATVPYKLFDVKQGEIEEEGRAGTAR